ncbi:YqxA family protein [Peribacillus sp. SCS-155]|uniref:YqxA family protein n=1 Tax=Peribacillus sedimenti TaxID=3115297 RepID=UPI0039063F0E
MFRFSLKCFGIMLVLFFGILLGMQNANQGMKKMKGYEDPALQSAFSVKESKTGDMEASVLGEKVTSHDIEKKKQQLEQMKAFNLFSSIGKTFSGVISAAIRHMAEAVNSWL